ncbi:MAG TPA: alkaline phosphatase family protein [Anaerolineae bacterium]|nr:alkaline phosphatase family protein [Anaerolineae bacterium]
MSNTLDLPAQFIQPRYEGGCFADLPGFIKSLLLPDATSPLAPVGFAGLPQRYRKVIFLFIDSFGWSFFQRHRERLPFLRRFSQQGSVTQLTSQFPSTTAAHVTTLYTGQPVGRHGIYEWHVYEPKLDAMIMPLPYAYSGDRAPETLQNSGVPPESFLPVNWLVEDLARHGVASYLSQFQGFAHSTYSRMIGRGATVAPHKTLPEALVNMTQTLQRHGGQAVYFLYFGAIDTISHDHGPTSAQVDAEIEACFDTLERWFQRDAASLPADTLLLLTADHGQVAVDPAATLNINQQPEFHKLRPMLRTTRQGQLLTPAGSCRDMFLHVKESALEDAELLVANMVGERGVVRRTSDLIEAGFFGPLPVSDTFLSRVGNLVVLSFEGEAVWWYEKDRFEQKFRGHHGGLTRGEMETPLLLAAL